MQFFEIVNQWYYKMKAFKYVFPMLWRTVYYGISAMSAISTYSYFVVLLEIILDHHDHCRYLSSQSDDAKLVIEKYTNCLFYSREQSFDLSTSSKVTQIIESDTK